MLRNLATVTARLHPPSIVNHYNIQPSYDIYADVDRRDLGGVASDIQQDHRSHAQESAARHVHRHARRGPDHEDSFTRLGLGIVFAVLLVYLLMVVNFQCWLDPFIILMALPGAFAGILWMLFITQTTFNVPSLMGSIMAIGVATANSILLVVFANDERSKARISRKPRSPPDTPACAPSS